MEEEVAGEKESEGEIEIGERLGDQASQIGGEEDKGGGTLRTRSDQSDRNRRNVSAAPSSHHRDLEIARERERKLCHYLLILRVCYRLV